MVLLDDQIQPSPWWCPFHGSLPQLVYLLCPGPAGGSIPAVWQTAREDAAHARTGGSSVPCSRQAFFPCAHIRIVLLRQNGQGDAGRNQYWRSFPMHSPC